MGLFGLGWDMNIPNITIETRWGVPRYDSENETEVYLLNGEQLLRMDDNNYNLIYPLTHRATWQPRNTSGKTYFCMRTEGSFNRIIRHGTTPKNYWWEVIDKQGTTYYYGRSLGGDNIHFPSVLTDIEGNVGKWMLTKVQDANNNYITYSYSKQFTSGINRIIPQTITYTGNGNTAGVYSVNFVEEILPNTFTQKTNARLGFLEVTNSVITNIIIKYGNNDIIKQYLFTYGGTLCYNLRKTAKLYSISLAKPVKFGYIFPYNYEANDPDIIRLQIFDYYPICLHPGWYPPPPFSEPISITDPLDEDLVTTLVSQIATLGTGRLGGSSDLSWGTGLTASLGIGFGAAWNKLITAGGNFLFNQNYSNGVKTLIDLDGDGLPDRVLKIPFYNHLFYQKLIYNNLTGNYSFSWIIALQGSPSYYQKDVTNSYDFGWEVQIGATLAGDYSTAKTKTTIYFSDINGDGLPDIIKDGNVYYNNLNENGVPEFSTLPSGSTTVPIAGTICLDLGMGSEDNGDGTISLGEPITDINKPGQVYCTRYYTQYADFNSWQELDAFLNALIENGYTIDTITGYEFLTFSWEVCDTIPPEIEVYPAHDFVKIWIAPYTGQIKITGDIILTENLMNKRDETDSLKVSIQLDTTIIFEQKLNPSLPSVSVNLTDLDINKDEHIYFRIESLGKKRYDKVFWQPEITYTQYNTTFIDANHQVLADANEQKIYKFNSSEDFLVNPKLIYGMPYSGIVKVESERIINEYLSDTVCFTIRKNDEIIFSDSHRDTVSGALNINNITVTTNDTISFEVLCKSNVKWRAIKWTPTLFYDNIDYQIIDGNIIDIPAYDDNFSPPKPNIKYDITPFYGCYPKPITPTGVFTPTNDMYINHISLINAPNSGYLSVKGSNGFVANISFGYSQAYISIPTIHFLVGVTYYFDICTSLELSSIYTYEAQIELFNNNTSLGLCNTGVHCQHDSEMLRFGNLYQNWGQFNYLNKSGQYTDKIIKDSLHLSTGLQNNMIDVNTLLSENPDDPAAIETASEIMSLWYQNNPHEEEQFLMMNADYANNQWVGYGNVSYVTADTMSNTFPCVLSNVQNFGNSGDMSIGIIPEEDYDELDENSAFTEMYAPVKKSETKNKVFAFNMSFPFGGIGGANTEGTIRSITDFRDLNGDCYPDEVGEYMVHFTQAQGGLSELIKSHVQHSASDEQIKSETIEYTGSSANFGASFAMSPKVENPDPPTFQVVNGSGGLSGSTNVSSPTTLWIDINGDGLPDKYNDEQIQKKIYYNLGYKYQPGIKISISDIKVDESETIGVSTGAGFDDYNGSFNGYNFNGFGTSISGGFGANISANSTNKDFIDIDGDGLPDYVYYLGNGSQSFAVQYNLGGVIPQFSTQQFLALPNIDFNLINILKSSKLNTNVNAAVTFGFCFWIVKIAINPKVNLGWGVSRVKSNFIDMNGDGLPDYVYEDDGIIKVCFNQLGKYNLLKSVTNIANGAFVIDYKLSDYNGFDGPNRTMVMDNLKIYDGFIGDGINYQSFEFEYDSAQYQRFDRENLGFKTVTTKQLDENNNVYRKTIEKYHNDKVISKGLKFNELITDENNNKYVETTYKYGLHELTSGSLINSEDLCAGKGYPALYEQITKYYEGGTYSQITTRKRFEYGAFGNIERYYHDGDINTPDDDFSAKMNFANIQANNRYIVGKQNVLKVYDNNNQLIRGRSCTIDNLTGNVTQIKNENNNQTAVIDITYDIYGNIDTLKLPKNHQNQRMFYKYIYDNYVHSYPIIIEDVFGYSSSSTYDYKLGKPLTITDINGNTTTYNYDWLGRPVLIQGPYENGFTIKFEYAVANINFIYFTTNFGIFSTNIDSLTVSIFENSYSPIWARTLHYDSDNPTNTINTMIFCDGLGKIIQTKKDAEIEGVEKRIVSGKNLYDIYGRLVNSYYPIEEDINIGDSVINFLTDNISPKTTKYDILDRPIKIIYPNNTTDSITYSIANDYNGTNRFKTVKTDALSNDIITYTDPQNLRTQITTVLGDTKFTYNALGELLQTIDPDNMITRYKYDLFGRQIMRAHMDAGTDSYTYDAAGNLITHQTQNLSNISQMIKYTYDYNRLKRIMYPQNPEMEVAYTYGAATSTNNRKGRITMLEDANGWTAYEYGKLGEVTKEKKHVILPNETNYNTFEMNYTYDTWNRIKNIYYPDGEVVNYTYDKGGLLKTIKGTKSTTTYINFPSYTTYNYIDSISYNKFEKRTFIKYGNNTTNAYTYNNMLRLETLISKTNSPVSQTMQNVEYQYDDIGNITQIQNIAGAITGGLGGQYTNTYQYDNAYRLTTGLNSQQLASGTQTKTSNLTYTNNGRILQKNHYETPAAVYTNNNYTYYLNTNQVEKTTAGGYLDPYSNYNWDANGNLSSVKTIQPLGTGGSTIIFARKHLWDEENRLMAVSDDDYGNYYMYDNRGERTYKISGTKQSLTLNGNPVSYCNFNNPTYYMFPYITVTPTAYTKHIFAGSERICSKIGNGRAGGPTAVPNPTFYPSANDYTAKRNAQNSMLNRIYNIVPTITHQGDNLMSNNLLQTRFTQMQTTNTTPETVMYFYYSDHLGSSSWITNNAGTPVQHLTYLPYGKEFINQRSTTFDADYKFSGKERDIETGYGYFGARYYSSELGIWISTDPLSDKYPSTTPFAYCRNNPIMLVDPNGMEDDWVRNGETGQYEWHDNVTSGANTPDGYVYVGKTDNDILYDMGLTSSYGSQKDKAWGVGTVSGDGVGPRGNGIGSANLDMVEANLSIRANTGTDPANISENNKNGMTFFGITATANISEQNANSYGGTNDNSFGTFSVHTNDGKYTSGFNTPTNAIYQKGTKPGVASVTIPASAFKNTTYLQGANVTKGYPRGNLYQGKININWNLQTRPMYRQGR
jgi:RHS repeat-associated protein